MKNFLLQKIKRGHLGWILCFLWIASAAPVAAWGPEGHRITASIAQLHLTPQAREMLQRDFNIERLDKASNWADQIKGKRKHTRSWHYTNIPAGVAHYDRLRDCPKGNCVTEKIKHFKRVFTRLGASRTEKVEALLFLIHFVADVHQPLHLGNRIDRGGNEIEFLQNGRPTNLHALWDHGLIAHPGKSLLEYAADLDQGIQKDHMLLWIATSVDDWSEESRALALSESYPLQLDPRGEPAKEYMERGRVLVTRQLQKGGIRLAHILNQLLK